MPNDAPPKESKTAKGIADLAPFVAAVLKDRSIHDLVEENKRLVEECKDRQLSLCVSASSGEQTCLSTSDGYVVKDSDGNLYLCVDIPEFTLINPHHGNPIIEICHSGVKVFSSEWEETFDHVLAGQELLAHHLVKKFVWMMYEDHDYLESNLVAILLDIEMIPGIMMALGEDVLHNARSAESCSWTIEFRGRKFAGTLDFGPGLKPATYVDSEGIETDENEDDDA